jgi:hypothetical protein
METCPTHGQHTGAECPRCAVEAELRYLTEAPHRANDPMHQPRIAELRKAVEDTEGTEDA